MALNDLSISKLFEDLPPERAPKVLAPSLLLLLLLGKTNTVVNGAKGAWTHYNPLVTKKTVTI